MISVTQCNLGENNGGKNLHMHILMNLFYLNLNGRLYLTFVLIQKDYNEKHIIKNWTNIYYSLP